MSLSDILAPGLRVVIAGTISARHRASREHYYAGPGNQFWVLLHEAGLTPRQLDPAEDEELLGHGIGLTDLVGTADGSGFELAAFHRAIGEAAPETVAFVSKTAATYYARATGNPRPRGYGPLSWDVAGGPAFVLPGPSGANNGMPLPLRIAMWRDLVDFLESL